MYSALTRWANIWGAYGACGEEMTDIGIGKSVVVSSIGEWMSVATIPPLRSGWQERTGRREKERAVSVPQGLKPTFLRSRNVGAEAPTPKSGLEKFRLATRIKKGAERKIRRARWIVPLGRKDLGLCG